MNIIEQIRTDKENLLIEVARLIREFEDKHEVVRVQKIEYGRYKLDERWRNNGDSWVTMEVKIEGI